MKRYIVEYTNEYCEARTLHVQGTLQDATETAHHYSIKYGDYGQVFVHEVNFVQSWEYDRWDNPKMKGYLSETNVFKLQENNPVWMEVFACDAWTG